MVTGFDLLGHSKMLHAHWAKRVAAFVVDAVVILVPLSILTAYFAGPMPVLGLASGLALFLYATLSEAFWRQTLGKRLFGLEVRAIWGPVTLSRAAVRNLPKFFWYIFPLLDFLMGMAIEGDPRQRFSDRILGTVVVSVRHAELPAPEGKGLPQHFHSEINCRACGGVLQSAGQSVLQCQACGLIQ